MQARELIVEGLEDAFQLIAQKSKCLTFGYRFLLQREVLHLFDVHVLLHPVKEAYEISGYARLGNTVIEDDTQQAKQAGERLFSVVGKQGVLQLRMLRKPADV